MTLNPTARAMARRNVAERIDRFLNGLQGARRLPNRRELFWLRDALANIQEGQYPAGEEAMDKAESMLAIPEYDHSTNAGMTVEQLRAQLDQIMKARGIGSADVQYLHLQALELPRLRQIFGTTIISGRAALCSQS